jgi:hypothetical protein
MAGHRFWNYISFSDNWKNCDTSLLDEIAPSWFARREVLQANSDEYRKFINWLKRRHAIETGIVERMYDIDKGVTETLINKGFISSLVSHGDTNILKQTFTTINVRNSGFCAFYKIVRRAREVLFGPGLGKHFSVN